MNRHKTQSKRKRNWFGIAAVTAVIGLILLVFGVALVRHSYNEGLKPASTSQESILFTVPNGASVQHVASELKEANLIRSSRSFEWYFRTHNLREHLQAGTYNLRPSLSVREIADILTEGKIATNLVTILPSQRIDQVRRSFIEKYGFSEASVEAALNPQQYSNHPALVDKPRGASLEGYLYPESFQKTAESTPQTIIKASLDEMARALTPDIRSGIAAQGLNVYQGIILASIIEREISHADAEHDLEDKQKVAQVFLRRLREGMLLQSDATASYGAMLAGTLGSLTKQQVLHFESRYNTYLHAGLPPTPISNVSTHSLRAVAQPAKTNFLYFLSGDDCTTHFSMTLPEHEANIDRYLTKGCGE